MQSLPLVSVVIPCYNYGRYLADALDSILNQTLTNWECIVVDDGSTDNTKQVVNFYIGKDERIRYVHQNNAGHYAARNNGLFHAKGKYIQFLDADDKLQSDKLLVHSSYMEQKPEVDLVYGDVIYFHETKTPPKENVLPAIFRKPRISGKDAVLLNNLLDDNFFTPGCTMFKKRIYDVIGGLKASYGFEDWEFWYRAAIQGFSFYYLATDGTALLARNHDFQTTKKHQEMMLSKLEVRKEIMAVINSLFEQGLLYHDKSFIKKLSDQHRHMLGLDKAFYNLRFGNILKGIKDVFVHAFASGKAYYAFYESYHMLRARQKHKNNQ